MSEIREGFGELDKIFVDDTTDVIVSSNGNTPSPEETNPRKIKANIADALPYYVFEDATTSAHLRAMIKKIDSILDAQVMIR